MSGIPLVDLHDADALREAFTTIGFAAVTGHGIDVAQFELVRSTIRELFALDDSVKHSLQITPDNYRGYIPLGFFTPNRAEVNGATPDRYEGYKLHWECPPGHPAMDQSRLYGPNRWPAALPNLAKAIGEYWSACDRAAEQLLHAFAHGLGVSPETMGAWHEAPLTNMTLLHYPPQEANSAGHGIHPHKDTNVITLLHPDPVGGLQVRAADGTWIVVDAPPDALVINAGEMLELWSGGRYKATPHRVVNTSGLDRYSFPFFVAPNHAVVVEPLLDRLDGFDKPAMPVGQLSEEVWRTNWAGQEPSEAGHDLGSLDR